LGKRLDGEDHMTTAPNALFDLLAAYQRIKEFDSPDVALALCAVTSGEPAPLPADEAAYDRVRDALAPPMAQGWARFRSATHATDEGQPVPNFADAGEPLRAEWRLDEDRSVRLSAAPSGGLIIRTYAERTLAPGETPPSGWRAALRQTVTVLRHPVPDGPATLGNEQAVLIYHVYWGASPEDPSAVRRLFDRFVGFDRQDRRLPREHRR
jgi:hypothetical protein